MSVLTSSIFGRIYRLIHTKSRHGVLDMQAPPCNNHFVPLTALESYILWDRTCHVTKEVQYSVLSFMVPLVDDTWGFWLPSFSNFMCFKIKTTNVVTIAMKSLIKMISWIIQFLFSMFASKSARFKERYILKEFISNRCQLRLTPGWDLHWANWKNVHIKLDRAENGSHGIKQ